MNIKSVKNTNKNMVFLLWPLDDCGDNDDYDDDNDYNDDDGGRIGHDDDYPVLK